MRRRMVVEVHSATRDPSPLLAAQESAGRPTAARLIITLNEVKGHKPAYASFASLRMTILTFVPPRAVESLP